MTDKNSGDSVDRQKLSPEISRRDFLLNSSSTVALTAVAGSLLSSSPLVAAADANNSGACSPSGLKVDPDMEARYRRAELIEQGQYTKKLFFNTTLYPNWIEGHDVFWYVRDYRESREYRLVDAAAGSNKVAFDHKVLARSLAKIAGEEVDAGNLPISDVTFTLSPLAITFAAFDKHWRFDAAAKRCVEIHPHPGDWLISPDGKKAAFSRDYNIWVHDLESGKEKPLTTDGEKFKVYAGTPTVYGRQEEISFEAIWSPDSKRLFTQVLDTREVKIAPPLVQHVPPDGSLRPTIFRPDRRTAFTDDEIREGYQFLSIEVDSGRRLDVDYRQVPIYHPPYHGYFRGNRGWWNKDSRRAYFTDLEIGGKTARLVEVDTYTGKLRVVLEEKNEDHFIFIPKTHIRIPTMVLSDSDELVWYSERSGSAHIYLYDLNSGKLKNAITQGDWLVRNILHFNPSTRELLIQTAGRVAGRNPYYCDICRVNIDTGKLTTVVEGNIDYLVMDPRSRMGRGDSTGVSPSGRYIVATRSRVDTVPESLLFNTGGELLQTLEKADVSGLPEGWQWPEPVMLKAADGKTDIYAIVYRPSDFSPDKKYPVVEMSTGKYPTPPGSFTNGDGAGRFYCSPAATAELGFIVVMVAARGTNIARDRAFAAGKSKVIHSEHNQADCIAAIKQLARRYPYMDLERVGHGTYGSSSSPVTAVYGYPDFYKVAITAFTLLDRHRLFGAFEKLPFPEDETPIEEMAHNLQGKLLIMHGMMDNVLPVAMSFRLVEALQKANKSFDMLLLPNAGHGTTGYMKRRQWDYLVEHLLHIEPPKDFHLTTGYELYLASKKK